MNRLMYKIVEKSGVENITTSYEESLEAKKRGAEVAEVFEYISDNHTEDWIRNYRK